MIHEAMIRLNTKHQRDGKVYSISARTGNRFPVGAAVGVFGVSSPVDVGVGRGGLACEMFLDIAELVRVFNIGFAKK